MSLNKFSIESAEKGVGMIEVVVALFILAVGLLGVLAMQANGIKGNQKAGFSTDVYLLAQDMADRIQAYNNIDIASDDDDYDSIDLSANAIPADPGCVSTGCTAAEQVEFDVYEWGTALATRLPNGKGKIDFDAATNLYTLVVMWDGNQDGSTGTSCNGGGGQMLCYTLEFKL